jgi:hypothetical protein
VICGIVEDREHGRTAFKLQISFHVEGIFRGFAPRSSGRQKEKLRDFKLSILQFLRVPKPHVYLVGQCIRTFTEPLHAAVHAQHDRANG